MVPEKQIDEFVSRMRNMAGDNLVSIVLYGSAASGEFHADFSNVNLLCVLRQSSFSKLTEIVPVMEWWSEQKHHPPLVLTGEELERSTDVFSIELLDMQQRHRLLYGADVLSGLPIPMQLHRAQLEYELREKIILLRSRMLAAGGQSKALWELLLTSFAAFVTLFRHALIALGQPAPGSKREVVEALAKHISFDPAAFLQVLDVRERKANRKQFDISEVFARYLDTVQHVVAAVDRILESSS